MKKRIGSLLTASALCLGLLSTAALADETTVPCVDGQHKETYGEPNCTVCGEPLRAAVSWDHGSVGGYYTEIKSAFEDAKLHMDSGGFELGYLRAYGPVKALGINGGHVRIDGGRYLWEWYWDSVDNDDNSGCMCRSLKLSITPGNTSQAVMIPSPLSLRSCQTAHPPSRASSAAPCA